MSGQARSCAGVGSPYFALNQEKMLGRTRRHQRGNSSSGPYSQRPMIQSDFRMKMFRLRQAGAVATGMRACLFAGVIGAMVRADDTPPELPREFRGAWVATVYNLDWPSKPGLPAEQQRAELRAVLDRAAELQLNAIVLQVRPQCDALYASKREPWSPFLTGQMGRAPEPPMTRCRTRSAKRMPVAWNCTLGSIHSGAMANAAHPVSSDHVSRTHPEWVRRYGAQLWVDPGESAARDYVTEVIVDVVRRYDLDGVHIDDYFYPYPTKDRADFPDDRSWQRYKAGGGSLERADWRRQNINQFVANLYRAIKAEKRWVKFGISPFGIWRPGVPPTIEAQLDSYAHLYADSRKWLNEGWCDYFSPQLYWSISPPKQGFSLLLNWWRAENQKGRHVWPGMATDRIGATRPAQEILNQIALTRNNSTRPGHIHWSYKSLARNNGGVAELLRRGPYNGMALVPASPWLGGFRAG
jgi:uncharacterized lipoprotein YddW (UPF0748 family)